MTPRTLANTGVACAPVPQKIADLTNTDLRQLTPQKFNQTHVEYPSHELIHCLVEQQARRTPHAVALVHGTQKVSYAELNARADGLARQLRAGGSGPGEIVGVCLNRGIDTVVGLLAALKTGAAYLPLDPNYPNERLEYMIADARPALVLTSHGLRDVLPEKLARVIYVGSEVEPRIAQNDKEVAERRAASHSEQLLYVIYTSGSTGRPKGVAMSHRAMVNLVEWQRRCFGSGAGCNVLQFAALSFDVAFQEIFTSLCGGATLVLLDEWMRRDARALVALLCEHFVHRLFMPPLMLQTLAEHYRSTGEFPRYLIDVIVAGEQLRISAEMIDFFAALPACRLHNHYGPTETHVVTALTLSGRAQEWPALPSIGVPIANSRIYILDDAARPVAVGEIGEVFIGGANVARGYLGRPELTAQRFVADVFSSDAHGRMYRTGDLGRWQPDGSIEYLGRNDDQVKIRGFRIELGEIEVQLARHPQVREAAVVAREHLPGQKRLLAYVTERQVGELTIEQLRSHALAILPEHMAPSAFVILDRLPLTQSGKLDRRALPEPEHLAGTPVGSEEPRGEVECALAEIWRQLLHIDTVGRQDHFFEVGGDSLAAMRLTSEVAERFGVRIQFQALFINLTLQLMAGLIEGLLQQGEAPSTPLAPQLEQGSI